LDYTGLKVKDSGRFYSSFTTLPSSTLEFTTIRGRKE
jgi:hypothetical protein